jgi:hypothetical protein
MLSTRDQYFIDLVLVVASSYEYEPELAVISQYTPTKPRRYRVVLQVSCFSGVFPLNEPTEDIAQHQRFYEDVCDYCESRPGWQFREESVEKPF